VGTAGVELGVLAAVGGGVMLGVLLAARCSERARASR
jgi:hypothetical protein